MCGAFVYVHPEEYSCRLADGFRWRAVVSDLIDQRPDLHSRFNIRPTQDVVVVFNESGGPVAKPMRWGLIPSWSKNEKMSRITFNARDDRVAESAIWKYPLERKRGIVLRMDFLSGKKPVILNRRCTLRPKKARFFNSLLCTILG